MRKGILLVSAVFPPEQVTSAYLNYDLAKALSADYDVTVLRPRPTRPLGVSFPDNEWSDPSFKTVLLASYTHPESELGGRLKEAVDFSRKAVDYLDEHHDDISFVYNDAWQLFGYYIVAKACVKYGIPYMVPIQDIYPECLLTKKRYPGIIKAVIHSLLLPFDRYYQKKAYRVRTISDEMADYLSRTRKIPRERYLVVNNWQNDEAFLEEPVWEMESGKRVFAYVGSINVHSNVELIIKAFAEADVPDSVMYIYGGGNQKEKCRQLVSDLGLENVHFGFVSRTEIPAIQSKAQVLVLALPSGNGRLCLPSKLTSYLLSGRPVIASVDEDSSTSRIIRGTGCGMTVAPDDVHALALAFREMSDKGKGELTQMGERSRSYAREHLTREVNLKRVVEVIDSIFDNDDKEKEN